MSLFSQGLQLMLYGMGTVVVFLTALVFATRLMSALLLRMSDSESADDAASRASEDFGANPAQSVDPRVLAAVTAAVHAHRATRS
ncbi:MAG: OadG family transporter subunit [Pseudomonadota bacterium]